MHVLQVHQDSDILDQYASTLDSASSKALSEYSNRALLKLNSESDPEEESDQEE